MAEQSPMLMSLLMLLPLRMVGSEFDTAPDTAVATGAGAGLVDVVTDIVVDVAIGSVRGGIMGLLLLEHEAESIGGLWHIVLELHQIESKCASTGEI